MGGHLGGAQVLNEGARAPQAPHSYATVIIPWVFPGSKMDSSLHFSLGGALVSLASLKLVGCCCPLVSLAAVPQIHAGSGHYIQYMFLIWSDSCNSLT